jgi:ferric-dicitrate binding protein FerR (iron transport regulator)
MRVTLDGHKELGWKSDLIIFDNANLEEVVRTLENWYGITMNVKGKSNNKWRINGEFENEKLENILKSLSFTGSFDYTVSDEITTLKFSKK